MKILLCTSEKGTGAGGLALHCVQLKEIFENLGHEVFVEVLLNPQDYFAIDGGYDPDLSRKIRASYMLKEIIEKYNQIDLCVSCGGGRTAYYSMLFSKSKRIPLNVVLCGSEINLAYENTDLAFYNSEALKYASSVIGLSNELNQNAKLLGTNSKCKYYVIPNYCEFNEAYGNKTAVDKKDVVFATGAAFLGEKKGIANLILAFGKMVKAKHRNDRLYLFGKIDSDIEEKYKRLITEHSLEGNIFLEGYLDRDVFHQRMDEVDVYIQASPFEGYGNSVAEAISEGKDILISDTGYIAETIKYKFPNHIIDSLNPDKFSEILGEYAEMTFKKNDVGLIREMLEEQLSKESVIIKWKDVLEETMKIDMEFSDGICNAVMFHDVDNSYSGVDYNKEGFKKLVNRVYNKGLKFCSVHEYFKSESKDNLVVCTFDDGYENVFKNAFPVLSEYGFTATVYICPDLIGKGNDWNHRDEVNRWHLTHEMILQLVAAGWEIGSHGLSHINLRRLSEQDLLNNLIKSKELLEVYGTIGSFCYPYGSFNDFIKDKVSKYYDNAFSVSIGGNNVKYDLYQITRLTPEEFKRRLEL